MTISIPLGVGSLPRVAFSIAWLVPLVAAAATDPTNLVQPASAPAPGIIDIGSVRQTFLDGRVLHELSRISRFVMRPQKYEKNPILIPDQPWEQGPLTFKEGAVEFSGIQISGQTVLYDEEERIFKMWYLPYVSWPGGKRPWCYATSKDGYHWEKPHLGLYDFQGSRANNIVADWGDPNYDNVIKDPQEKDPARRYKALGEVEGPVPNHTGGVAIAFSPDGLHWTQYEHNPVVKHGPDIGDAPTMLGWDPKKKKYVGYYRPGHPLAPEINGNGDHRHIRSYGYAESEDFVHWTPTRLMLAPDDADRVDTQYMQWTGGIDGEFYIGFNAIHQSHEQTWDIFLMSSRDGFHWNWVDRNTPFMIRGEIGSYDAGYTTPSGPIFHDNQVWIFYAGYSGAHSFNPSKLGRQSRFTINLCTLPQDRWLGLLAGPSLGTVVTRPLLFEGSKLVVDLDPSLPDQAPRKPNPRFDECELRAALLDQSGGAVPGFGLSDSAVITTGGRQELAWRGGDLRQFAGKPMRLRFEYRNAALYSFQFN